MMVGRQRLLVISALSVAGVTCGIRGLAAQDIAIPAVPPATEVRTPASAGWIHTDSVAYTAQRSGPGILVALKATLTNRGSSPIYIDPCRGSVAVQKQEAERWVPAWAPDHLLMCNPDTLMIAPGQSRVIADSVRAFSPGTRGSGAWLTTISGMYRIRAFVKRIRVPNDTGRAVHEAVPDSLLASNEFQLLEE